MGPRLVAWSLILFGLERMFCLLIFNIGINCLTLKCWEITFWNLNCPHFYKSMKSQESSFQRGISSPATHSVHPTQLFLLCNYQLPSLLTQLFSPMMKRLDSIVLFQSRKRSCSRRQCVPHSSDVSNWPWGYLTLWPWAKRWGHVHQSIATHYPNSQIGIEIQVQTVVFTFKWLLPYHLAVMALVGFSGAQMVKESACYTVRRGFNLWV